MFFVNSEASVRIGMHRPTKKNQTMIDVKQQLSNLRKERIECQSYLFEIADCDEPVLIHDAFDIVERILLVPWPRFSKSPVLFCFFNFKPCK